MRKIDDETFVNELINAAHSCMTFEIGQGYLVQNLEKVMDQYIDRWNEKSKKQTV